MSLGQNVGISRWHLGFGAITGTIYYFTNSTNRQNFQNYMYHTVSNIFAELGHVNILILLCIAFISFTKFNYSLIFSLPTLNNIWSRSFIKFIFIFLRIISTIKILIALIRGSIKSRKFDKFQKSKNIIAKYPNSIHTNTHNILNEINYFNNKCIICYDDLYPNIQNIINNNNENNNCDNNNDSDNDSDNFEKILKLDCDHIFHADCFRQWYSLSEKCPYCRCKVD